MSSQILNQYILGDMELTYLINDRQQVGMMFLPSSAAHRAEYLTGDIESLVQLYLRGDPLPGGFSNGLTLADGVLEIQLKANFEAIAVALE